jgi:alpha-galactosidase
MPSESDRAATINVGDIAPGADANVAVPIDFSRCSDSARFNVSLVFSANNGADVGNVIETSETK